MYRKTEHYPRLDPSARMSQMRFVAFSRFVVGDLH